MKLPIRFFRFLAVGCVGLLVLLGTTYILTEFFHFWYFWSYIVATLLSWTCIFLLNSLFTFAGHSKKRYGSKYALFLAMYLGSFAVNASIVYTLTSVMHVPYLVSIFVATAITTTLTYTASKRIIFTYEEPTA